MSSLTSGSIAVVISASSGNSSAATEAAVDVSLSTTSATAETTSPSVLRRRGWSQDSFRPGEMVRLQGLPSVDGSYLIRITRAFREDGTEVGVPRGTDN